MTLYHIEPFVFKTHQRQQIVVKPLYRYLNFTKKNYSIFAKAMETQETTNIDAKVDNGCLAFEMMFGEEQEYKLILDDGRTFSIYCVDEDLYGRKPYKGDFHIHSCMSDGTEDPEFVAAAARSIGMDFIALTDHYQYEPSLQAIEILKEFKTDFLLLPGEEVHPPGNPIHIINFGGKYSINKMITEIPMHSKGMADPVSQYKNVSELSESDKRHFSECQWCYNEIDNAGGISLLCHPYWITDEQYNVSKTLLECLLQNKKFTAFELLGGHTTESNNLQTAYYHQKQKEGLEIPIVGVSDAHGTFGHDYFGWTYTVLFSETLSLNEIKKSVENYYSVAVEQKPGQEVRVYGNFRLVKYVLFLLREYFPAHDQECALEGASMFKYIKNNKEEENQ